MAPREPECRKPGPLLQGAPLQQNCRAPARKRTALPSRFPPVKYATSAIAARWGCAYFFAINGLAYGSIVARMPVLKAQAALDAGELGRAIFCLGIGGLLAFPLAGVLQGRIGSKAVASMGAVLLLLAWPAVGLAAGWWSLAAAFFVFGFANGTLEVGGGVQAVTLEKAGGAPVMSGLFALYSLGNLAGAVLAAALSGLPLVTHYGLLASVSLLALPLAARRLLPDGRGTRGRQAEQARLRLPPLALLAIAGLALCAMVAEGAVSDWGALLMKARHASSDALAALAYAAFSATMILGRLFGDRLRAACETVVLVRIMALIATAGMLTAIAAPHAALGIAGFAAAGLGLSVIAPIMFSTAGRHPAVDPGVAIASMTTLGYGGLLLGPAGIGFLADSIGLPAAMLSVAGLCAVIALLAGTVRR